MYGGGGGGRKGVPPVCRSVVNFFPPNRLRFRFSRLFFRLFLFLGPSRPVPSLGYRTTSLPVQQRGGGGKTFVAGNLVRVTPRTEYPVLNPT